MATSTILTIVGVVGFTCLIIVFVVGITILVSRTIRGSYGSGTIKNGVSAPATIMRIWDTGTTINENPLVGFELQVTPPGAAPFVVECKQMINRLELASIQPGAAVTVSYDPTDPKKIHITELGSVSSVASVNVQAIPGMPAGQPVSQAVIEQRLQQIDAANQVLIATGQSAQAQVIRYTDWNVKVNGENPAVTLQLQVMPPGKPQFMAEASGVISEASIPKFQPGCTIFVKYDPNNLTKVTIHHS